MRMLLESAAAQLVRFFFSKPYIDNVSVRVRVRDGSTVPGPLPLLGLGVTFGYSRKLRKRIKTSNTPEGMSAIG
jgi:hypothetical protein